MRTVRKIDTKWMIKVLCALVLGIMLAAVPVFADDYTVLVPGTFGQTDAREMLAMINDFRTGSDAWYWNSTNSSKVQVTNLKELTYDYNLEKIAMQRAAETALSFSHTRPNGGSCFSAIYNGTQSWGENIAAGSSTASATFVQWREDNYNYSGQGHRRNMLSSSFTAIGIAHVKVAGIHYWVQEFGYSNSGAAAEDPLDKSVAFTVDINSNSIQSVVFQPSDGTESMEVEVLDEYTLPEMTAGVLLDDAWPYRAKATVYAPNWESDDPNIAEISADGKKLIARKVGTTSVTATYLNKTFTLPVTITPIDIASDTPTAEDRVYTGAPQEPAVTLKHGTTTLIKGTDYDVEYVGAHTDAAEVQIRVTGKGNYKGTAVGSFRIKPASLATAAFSAIDAVTYNGQAHTPAFSVTWNDMTLSNTDDFTTEFAQNTDAGTATVTITGKGNFENETSTTFVINPLSIEENDFSLTITDPTYTGDALQPEMAFSNSFATLKADTDFTAEFTSNINAGENTAEATLTGKGNYCGTRTEHFSILPRNLQDEEVLLSVDGEYIFNGEPHVPGEDQIALSYRNRALVQGTDYDISDITNNVNAGNAVITLQGKGNYTGTAEKTFAILPKDITELAEIGAIEDVIFNGNEQTPAATVLLNGTEMTADEVAISYNNNVNAGTAAVRAEGKGNYTGSVETTFAILPAELTSENATASPLPDQTATGKPIELRPTVKWNGMTLTENTDYTLDFANNTAPGTATVKITGTGNFTGGFETTFVIKENKTPGTVPSVWPDNGDSPYCPATTGKGGPAGEGASESVATAAITSANSDEGPAGTKFSLLQAQQKKVTKNSITIKWKKISGATYKVFGNACGKKNHYVLLGETKAASYKHKGLKKGTYYKYLVVAVKNGKVVSASKTLHIATSGKKVGNNTKVTISKKTLKLKKGKSKKLTAKAKKGKLKVKNHRKLAWESSDPTVVSVKKGKVKALKKGSATIYVYAQNGKYAKCKVTVK